MEFPLLAVSGTKTSSASGQKQTFELARKHLDPYCELRQIPNQHKVAAMPLLSRKDLSWTIELVTLVAVIVGLSFAAIELRQLRKAQETQTLLTLFEPLRSAEHVAAVGLILALPDGLSAQELLERLNEDELNKANQVHATFEAIGVMVYRGDISLDWIDELYRYTAIATWEKMERLTLERRKNYRGVWEWHQWLVDRLRERNPNPVPAYEAYADWEE